MGIFDRVRNMFTQDSAPLDSEDSEQGEQQSQDGVPGLPSQAYTGGLINPLTGAGTSQDKTKGFYYVQHNWSRDQLDSIADNSWAAGKVIEIPVDDCFNRWRAWLDSERVEELQEYERKTKVRKIMRDLMITGRKYGTALGVMLIKDDETSRPLDLDNIEKGDLIRVIVVDRFCSEIEEWYEDPFEEEGDFGTPKMYKITFPVGNRTLKVHPSRVLRFDGIERTSKSQQLPKRWGIPVLQRVIDAVVAEDATAGAAAHLVQEASVKIMRMGDIKALQAAGKVASFKKELQRINIFKSIYRMFVIPNDARYERQTYTFGGIKDLMDRQMIRVSAGADIPVTRFAGRSPAGLDATGESDDANYARKVKSEQDKMRVLLERFDAVAMRSYGIDIEDGEPDYEFASIMDQSDSAKADAERKKAEALRTAKQEKAISANEMRRSLSGGPVFGELSGPAPDQDDPQEPPSGGIVIEPGSGSGEEGEEGET